MVKIIRIPESISGYDEPIDDFQAIIDMPEFQRLREIKQLDLIYKVFPGATHTRFEHSVGALHHERSILDNIEKNAGYTFDKIEKKTSELAALLHDFGHSPYSHGIEFVLIGFGEPDHDKKTLERIEELEKKINKISSIDYELLKEIFERKSPLYKTIWGLTGADVLDYITRDSNRCGVPVNSDTDKIETYVYFDRNEYGIDSKVRDTVRSHVHSYLFMYTDVYNRKACSFWKGLIRRGLYEAIKQEKIKPEDVWNMTDCELKNALMNSGGVAKKMYERIRDREQAKTFLSIKLDYMGSQEETRGKPIKVFEMPENELMKIVKQFENIGDVIEFEKSVEADIGLYAGAVTLAEMPHIKMLAPKDVPLYNIDNGWTSLFKEIEGVKEDFNRDVRRKYTLRIGVEQPYRKKAFEQSDKIFEYLKSFG